jgi:hypothetical protein
VPDPGKSYVVLIRWGESSRRLTVPGDILQRFAFAGRIVYNSEGKFYETTSRFSDFVTRLREQEGVHVSVDGP